jgi:hypothetical protein
MVHYDVEGDLDEASIDPRLLGYFQASRKLKDAARAKVLIHDGRPVVERVMGCAVLGIGGTGDWFGSLFDHPIAYIDWKTGEPYPWHAIQGAVYVHLAKANGIIPKDAKVARFGGYLRVDGTFKVEHYDNPGDLAIAMASLTLAKFKLSTQATSRRVEESDLEIFD